MRSTCASVSSQQQVLACMCGCNSCKRSLSSWYPAHVISSVSLATINFSKSSSRIMTLWEKMAWSNEFSGPSVPSNTMYFFVFSILDEYWFLLWFSEGRVKIWHKQHERMDPSSPVSTVQGGGVIFLASEIFSWLTFEFLSSDWVFKHHSQPKYCCWPCPSFYDHSVSIL